MKLKMLFNCWSISCWSYNKEYLSESGEWTYMNVTMRREQRNTYMASIVSSDPMRPRCDTKLFLAVPLKALIVERIRYEHGIISFAQHGHHISVHLNFGRLMEACWNWFLLFFTPFFCPLLSKNKWKSNPVHSNIF